jgi:putative transposase
MTKVMDIAPGVTVGADNKRYTVTHLLDMESVLAKDSETGKTERLCIKDLSVPKDDKDKEASGEQEISLISDKDWQEGQRRFSIIRPLLTGRRTKEMVREIAEKEGVHPVTIYRWISVYERTERTSELIPTKPRGGKGKSRLTPEVEAIVGSVIKDVYLKKASIEKTCSEIRDRCSKANLQPPHNNTIRNRIAVITDRKKLERSAGPKAAADKFDLRPGTFPGADWPLAVVQIDHTKVDIILVDDIYRLPVGRPWITLAMDVFSRMVTGFYISFDPPGAMSVGLCIANSILPKEKWLAKYDITIPWSCWGFMKAIHLDNAKEFRGNMLKRACQVHGIDIEFRPVATPHYGGHIERLLGTLMEEIHSLPGTTFSNPVERADYDSDSQSAMTFTEFVEWLLTLITGVYHQRIHSALGTSPIKQYEKGIFGTKDNPGVGLPARIIDEDRLRLDFMPYLERVIHPFGVAIDNVHYADDVLRRYVKALDSDTGLTRKFIFKRDPRDISVLYFYDPEIQQYFPIPYRDRSHPPISVWELREITRRLKEQGRKEINETLIFDAHRRMNEVREKSVRETKSARRARQRRSLHSQIEKPLLNNSQLDPPLDNKELPKERKRVIPFEVVEEA